MGHKTRIMYIENKGGKVVETWGGQSLHEASLTGLGRIGRVTFSKTGRSLTYGGKSFSRAAGFKANYVCETGEWFWISGPKKRGGDALYATNIPTEIDEDVRDEYWTEIRKQPERKGETNTN
jgi:hypothetical protein